SWRAARTDVRRVGAVLAGGSADRRPARRVRPQRAGWAVVVAARVADEAGRGDVGQLAELAAHRAPERLDVGIRQLAQAKGVPAAQPGEPAARLREREADLPAAAALLPASERSQYAVGGELAGRVTQRPYGQQDRAVLTAYLSGFHRDAKGCLHQPVEAAQSAPRPEPAVGADRHADDAWAQPRHL